MKKRLLLGMLLLAGLGANAQLANGTTAPDFTVTDINGNTHTLSEYLAQGKTVIIDISATWCGPCWNYHGTHALEDLHYAYGPEGSDEVVVLFVEGDPTTSVSSIYGVNTPSDTSTTQGDWTIGSPYPIIDSGEISELYDIAYFPTVYRICPDGILSLVDQQSFVQLRNGINGDCGTMTGVQNHAKINATDTRTCEITGNVSTKLKNYGTNPITAATVVLKENGNVVATKDYTGSVNPNSAATVNFEDVNLTPSASYTAEIVTINNNAPFNEELIQSEFNVAIANQSPNNIMVNVFTDNYPGEISWRIKDSNNTVVYTGGPYQAGPGNAGAGGPDANTTKTHWLTLPDGIDCYTVELRDAYGDGWSLGETPHGLEIIAGGETVFTTTAGNFGNSLVIPAALKTMGILGAQQVETTTFAIYPNPSEGVIYFTTPEEVNVTVFDITGKIVHTAKGINNGGSINLSNLQSGMYIAKVQGASTERIEKIVIQ